MLFNRAPLDGCGIRTKEVGDVKDHAGRQHRRCCPLVFSLFLWCFRSLDGVSVDDVVLSTLWLCLLYQIYWLFASHNLSIIFKEQLENVFLASLSTAATAGCTTTSNPTTSNPLSANVGYNRNFNPNMPRQQSPTNGLEGLNQPVLRPSNHQPTGLQSTHQLKPHHPQVFRCLLPAVSVDTPKKCPEDEKVPIKSM